MTVTHMRFEKSETRDLAERARLSLRLGEAEPWHASNALFFGAFVVVVGMLAVFALAVR